MTPKSENSDRRWRNRARNSRIRLKRKARNSEPRWKIMSTGSGLRLKRRDERIEAQGQRVSQAELDQARLNGVNSVLVQHIHTHEPTIGAD